MPKTSENMPRHVAIILDGNRRWAKTRGLPTLSGHKRGAEQVRTILKHAQKIGIKIFTVYAFSTENWNRTKEEVGYLMELLIDFIDSHIAEMKSKGVRFVHLGSRDNLSKKILGKIDMAVSQTAANDKIIFCMALNYGGRDEILRAVKKIISENTQVAGITPETISAHLDTAGLPDPDLIIRTSGEQRLSGFLPWQGVYSELYFTPCFWPDFDASELDKAVSEYQSRMRRYGK
jgi:undecaprenyl diphosphate synthase